MTTSKRHVKVEIADDDLDFAEELESEGELNDPPEASEHQQEDAQQGYRGYRR